MGDKKILTREVLKVIAVSGILIGTLAIPTLPIAVAAAMKIWKNVNKKDLGRIIKRLEKQEMVSISETGKGFSLEITDKGKKRLLEYDFENMELKNKRRDGKWRLVIFDIPEDKKSSRDVFRRKLLDLDFVKLQESVFASVYPCKNEIDFMCHFLGISDFVTIALVNKIERGEHLIFKKYYDYGDN